MTEIISGIAKIDFIKSVLVVLRRNSQGVSVYVMAQLWGSGHNVHVMVEEASRLIHRHVVRSHVHGTLSETDWDSWTAQLGAPLLSELDPETRKYLELSVRKAISYNLTDLRLGGFLVVEIMEESYPSPISKSMQSVELRLNQLVDELAFFEAGGQDKVPDAATMHLNRGAAALHLSKMLEEVAGESIGDARNAGATWRTVAEALGVTSSAAWRRWDEEGKKKHASYQRARSGRTSGSSE